MKTRKLKFTAHESKDNVSAILQIPTNANALIVLGHGAGAGMLHANMESIAAALHSQHQGADAVSIGNT